MIKTVIVDDEPLAREGLSNYAKEVDFLTIIDTCENPLELVEILDSQTVDLIFLDIQMSKMNGIDFLKITKNLPMVIITTAYPSYAIEGFRLNVLDYLLKPITFDRFVQAVQKAKEQFILKSDKKEVLDSYFFVKCEHKYEKIYFDEILYIQGLQNYVAIHTTKGKHITLLNLKDIEGKLDPLHFMRVHKSYIIAITKIETVVSHEIKIQNTLIPLSRNYRDQVLKTVVEEKLWKK
ncbi:LytR/AlgR family response regulator transcription factor [Aquimarina litoralis]|uniref:LytR/AlgR family response regulator transcription factor n=1 Tax=Aquimarina litoralis TaxID=584605 RepID=UPI001C56AF2E|nr:LytTR family DNA-binding domain-containing protein [Aquimarina litoralis]MBW1295220.1 response regulator [Aquimarina litoralis]